MWKFNQRELMIRLIMISSTVLVFFVDLIGLGIAKYAQYLIVAFTLLMLPTMSISFKQTIIFFVILIASLVTLIIKDLIIGNWLVFITSLIFAIDLFQKGIDEKTWKCVKICTVISALWCIFSDYIGTGYSDDGDLMLWFNNPNMTGIALSAPAIILILMLAEEKKLVRRIIWIVLLLLTMSLIAATKNRGSLIWVLAMLVFAVLAMKKRSVRITGRVAYGILKLLPIIVMIIYVLLYSVMPDDVMILDKPFFSGRENGWIAAIQALFANPFALHNFEKGTLNLFLEGIVQYSIWGIVAYFALLFTFKKQDLKTTSIRNYLAFLSFHVMLWQQSFESTLITGSYSVYIWSYILLGVASMRDQKTEEPQRINE